MIGEPLDSSVLMHDLGMGAGDAYMVMRALAPFNARELELESLADGWSGWKYARRYLHALHGAGIAAKRIREISLSECMLPVDALDTLPESFRRSVRLGILSGIGNGMRVHFRQVLEERYAQLLSAHDTFFLHHSALLERMLATSIVNAQLEALNRRYHDAFRPKLFATDFLPFSLPSLLYYQVALRMVGHRMYADHLAELNAFVLDGHPPLGMLHDGSIAVLGR